MAPFAHSASEAVFRSAIFSWLAWLVLELEVWPQPAVTSSWLAPIWALEMGIMEVLETRSLFDLIFSRAMSDYRLKIALVNRSSQYIFRYICQSSFFPLLAILTVYQIGSNPPLTVMDSTSTELSSPPSVVP